MYMCIVAYLLYEYTTLGYSLFYPQRDITVQLWNKPMAFEQLTTEFTNSRKHLPTFRSMQWIFADYRRPTLIPTSTRVYCQGYSSVFLNGHIRWVSWLKSRNLNATCSLVFIFRSGWQILDKGFRFIEVYEPNVTNELLDIFGTSSLL